MAFFEGKQARQKIVLRTTHACIGTVVQNDCRLLYSVRMGKKIIGPFGKVSRAIRLPGNTTTIDTRQIPDRS